MTRNPSVIGTGQLPLGLLGAIVLLTAIETQVARHSLDFSRFYIDDWKVAGQSARSASSGCDVLCFGDSLVKFGIHPRVISARLGVRAYNLAVCDGQASSSYFLLRRALESGARPRAVVVDFVPHLLAAGPMHNLRQWPELIDAREGIDLGGTTRHAGMCAELVLGSVFPSVKDRFEIRGFCAAALRGSTISPRGEILEHRDGWKRNQGAEESPERSSFHGEIDGANPGYFPQRWSCHPVNEAYLRRFLELAEAHSVHVFWLLPPVTPKFQQRREILGLEDSYIRFIQRLQRAHSRLTILDARRAGFDHTAFIDPLHLNRRGAVALTNIVAVAITGSSPAQAHPRWVSLSASQARFATSGTSAEPGLAMIHEEIGHE